MNVVKFISEQCAKPEGVAGKLTTLAMNIGNQSLYQSVRSQIPDDRSASILDVGYGNGYLMKKLLHCGYQDVSGLEISASMQAKVSVKLKTEIKQQTCHIMLGLLEDALAPDQSYDVIYSINTLYFWRSLEEGLKQLYRMVKHDGIVILAFYDREFLVKLPSSKYGFQLYETSEFTNKCIETGFRVEKVIKKGKGTKLCYVLKKAG